MTLEQELKIYEANKESLLVDEGKYVVICGDQIIGTFVAYEDALKKGYEISEPGKFLVKKIQAIEKACWITRNIFNPCPM